MAFLFDRWLALALYTSTGSILVLAHGLANAGPTFTALFISASTLMLLLLNRWADFTFSPCDLLFGIFLGCIAASFAANGASPDSKENILLALSLVGYPAARLLAGSKAVGRSFLFFTSGIIAVGAIATGKALIDQWSAHHGKPFVFGEFDAAPAQFTASLGFLAIALICTKRNLQQTLIVSALLSVPAIIFAASVVRLPFIAIVAALGGSALAVRTAQERSAIMVTICAVLVGLVAGNLARSDTTKKFARYGIVAISEAAPTSSKAAPSELSSATPTSKAAPVAAQVTQASTCSTVDADNSLAIRRQLYSKALGLIPEAGLFGIGLDRFKGLPCTNGAEIHNSILQATVELGWIGGAALTVLLVTALASLWPLASESSEARFVLCGLILAASLSMGGGRISRDSLLFLFLGYAAGMRSHLARSASGFRKG